MAWDSETTSQLIKWVIICGSTAGLLIFLIFRYDTYIRELFGRVSKVGHAEFLPLPQEVAESNDPPVPIENRIQDESALRPFFQAFENSISSALTTRYPDPVARAAQAIRGMAVMAGASDLDYINFYVYGSQIEALQKANSAPQSRQQLIAAYTVGMMGSPGHYEGVSFDRWLDFLVQYGLLAQAGDVWQLTMKGHEFLRHLVERRYPVTRVA